MIRCIQFTLLFMLPLQILVAQNSSYTQLLSPSQIREDYKIFRDALTDAHPAAYRHNSQKNLNYYYDSIQNSMNDSMSVEEFTKLLKQSVAKIRCVHTSADFPASFHQHSAVHNNTLLPLNLKFVGQEAYISENLNNDTAALYIGNKLISINGVMVKDYFKEFYSLLSADGFIQTSRYEQLGDRFKVYLSIFKNRPDTFFLLTEDPITKEQRNFKVPAVTVNQMLDYYKGKRNGYLPFRFKIIDHQTAYLAMDDFLIGNLKSYHLNYKKFFAASFKKIKEAGIKHLIIDIRKNQGGHGQVVATLFSYLAQKSFVPDLSNSIKYLRFDQPYMKYETKPKLSPLNRNHATLTDSGFYSLSCFHESLKKPWHPKKGAFRGHTSLLVSGSTYSAGSQFALLYNSQKRGPIIGEETGGITFGPTGYERLNLELPNSKSTVSIPLIITRSNVENGDFRHGVIPTHEVSDVEKITSLKEKSDPELTKAMNLFKSIGQ